MRLRLREIPRPVEAAHVTASFRIENGMVREIPTPTSIGVNERGVLVARYR